MAGGRGKYASSSQRAERERERRTSTRECECEFVSVKQTSRWIAANRTVLAGQDGVVRFLFAGPDYRMAELNSRLAASRAALERPGFAVRRVPLILAWK